MNIFSMLSRLISKEQDAPSDELVKAMSQVLTSLNRMGCFEESEAISDLFMDMKYTESLMLARDVYKKRALPSLTDKLEAKGFVFAAKEIRERNYDNSALDLALEIVDQIS